VIRAILICLLAITGGNTLLHGQQRCMPNAQQSAMTEDKRLVREARLEEWIANNPVGWRTAGTIPVVFHVIYNTPEENISDLQIQSQVDALNRDMNALTPYPSRIPDEFRGREVTMDLRFCLATQDPAGQPTSGITRKQTDVVNFGLQAVSGGRRAVHYAQFGGQDAWDQDRYINIWVVSLGGFLGFAAFPDTGFPEEDGIILAPDAVGTVGSAVAPYDEGHTLTHELGHYFDLYHLWGPETGCFNDDFVEDTPPQENGYDSCPPHPQVSCGSPDMFMNFMDFVYDGCMAMFTQGQRDRLYAALNIYRPLLVQGNPPCAPLDGDPVQLGGVRVFFAPSQNAIVIADERPIADPVFLRLYSIDGKELWSGYWQSSFLTTIEANGLPTGMYIVMLDTATQKDTRKVLVYH
jgi:hypothetical protein